MSAAERAASMSPDELIAVVTAGLDADERSARTAAAANAGSAATRWSAERVDYLSGTGLRGKAWAVVPERVKGVAIAISPTDVRPRFVAHIARHDPSRVLADVESKRAIVDRFKQLRTYAERPYDTETSDEETRIRRAGYLHALEVVLADLARPYLTQETP